jgi:WD40 repeat protein
VGLSADAFRARVSGSEALVKHVGALRAGGTVTRQLWVQAFGDVARELQLGGLYQSNLNGPTRRDNTGELDPLGAGGESANGWAFTPDGRKALVASGDRSVRYYDVEGQRDLKRLVGHTGSVWAVALSPDGKWGASGGMDGTARVWDLAAGLEAAKYRDHTSLVSAVAFTPNSKWVVSGSFDGSVAHWNAATGAEGWRVEKLGLVTSLAVDPQGKFVAVGYAGRGGVAQPRRRVRVEAPGAVRGAGVGGGDQPRREVARGRGRRGHGSRVAGRRR